MRSFSWSHWRTQLCKWKIWPWHPNYACTSIRFKPKHDIIWQSSQPWLTCFALHPPTLVDMLYASEIRIGTGMHNSSGKLGIRVGQTLIFLPVFSVSGEVNAVTLCDFQDLRKGHSHWLWNQRREIVFNGGEWLQANYLKNPWQSQSTALLIKRLLLPLPQSATPSSQTVGPFLSPWWGPIFIKSRNSAHSNSHLPSPSDHCWTPSLKVAPLV